MIRYNIGCGDKKWKGFVNVDIEKSVKPDILMDIRHSQLPCGKGEASEIWMFHTIEHITKNNWKGIFIEFNRALKNDGVLNLAYPEFIKCVENWKNNKHDDRQYWEATLYGRQLYPGDFHVAICDTDEITGMLKDYGFGKIRSAPEQEPNEYYTVLTCRRMHEIVSRESLMSKEVFAA